MGTHYIIGNLLEELDHRDSQRYLQSLGWREIRNSATWRAEVVVSGSVADGIANFAREHDVDLIAMYTNDRGLIGRMFKRSVTRQVQRIRPHRGPGGWTNGGGRVHPHDAEGYGRRGRNREVQARGPVRRSVR